MTSFTFTHDTIQDAAKAVLARFPEEKVFAISGAMGAGKTTLTAALCGQLQVKEHTSSPTFSLINQYETANGSTVYHIDLYRLKDAEEARAAGIEDALYSGHYCFVEWPAIAPEIFPPHTLCITITPVSATGRKIEFSRMD